ncbi:MAG: acetylornithine deacetylase [Paracoccaceae bacterium]
MEASHPNPPINDVIDHLARLVGFDTTSRNSNLPIIDYIEAFLASHGIASCRYEHDGGRKANLYATIGPADRGGILLSGHTDVVPVDGQDWASDPFTLTRRNDRLYGRGACDMKGFLAAMLAAVPDLVRRRLNIPVHLAFSCDEEVGCTGVVPMITGIVAEHPLPMMAVVGEPTMMQVISAHKGYMTFVTEITGVAAHSSDPGAGASAIMAAVPLLATLGAIADDLRQAPDPASRFNPPCTTLNVGTITGGNATNIVPAACSFIWELRPLPGFDTGPLLERFSPVAALAEKEMRSRHPAARIVTRPLVDMPGLAATPGSEVERLALHFARGNSVSAVPYGTEAGLFRQAGIPTVVCGPGSIEQAHRPDEYIEIDQLRACAEFLRRLADHCSADPG